MGRVAPGITTNRSGFVGALGGNSQGNRHLFWAAILVGQSASAWAFLLWLPRGRRLDSKPSRRAVRGIRGKFPNGRPRRRHSRRPQHKSPSLPARCDLGRSAPHRCRTPSAVSSPRCAAAGAGASGAPCTTPSARLFGPRSAAPPRPSPLHLRSARRRRRRERQITAGPDGVFVAARRVVLGGLSLAPAFLGRLHRRLACAP
jgi:hypothetical protein